jgi:hypothetical protein
VPVHGDQWAFAAAIGFAAIGRLSATLLLGQRIKTRGVERNASDPAFGSSPSQSS